GAPSVVTSVVTGLLMGLLSLTMSTALATLVYGSALEQFLDKAIGLALLSTLAMSSIGLLLGSLPGVWVQLQDAPAAVLSGAAAAMAAARCVAAAGLGTFMTVVVLAALSALVSGALFMAFGLFKVGRVVRLSPCPVIGGFMA